MRLMRLKLIGSAFLLSSCSTKSTLPLVCSGKSSQQVVHPSQLNSVENNFFLSNWNGLTGVVAGTGVAPELPLNALCKVYVETVPDQSKSNGAKFYLWYNENCQPKGKKWLFLAFPKGYIKFDFIAKSSVVNPQAMNSSLSVRKNYITSSIFSRTWSVSEWLMRTHGPSAGDLLDKTVSYNPYAHVIEEIEILPSSIQAVNDFLKLVTQKQLERRKQLIPEELEASLDVFRNFFLEKAVLKRILIDFSQSNMGFSLQDSDYRFCPSGTSADDCSLEQQRLTETLQQSLSPDLWAEVKTYFYPSNTTIPNYDKVKTLDRQPLNDAIRQLFKPELMWLRLPQENQAAATLQQEGFNDHLFTLPQVSEYALTTSPLEYGEPESRDNLIFVKNLQPADFCGQSPLWDRLSRVTKVLSMGQNLQEFTLGVGGAMIGWGGMIPFAFKRPVWSSCQKAQPRTSGGASITPLPETVLSEDSLIPEKDLSAMVQENNTDAPTSGKATSGKATSSKTTSCFISK